MTALWWVASLIIVGLVAHVWGVHRGDATGWQRGYGDCHAQQVLDREGAAAIRAAEKHARRSDGAKRGAATRKRNRETPQA